MPRPKKIKAEHAAAVPKPVAEKVIITFDGKYAADRRLVADKMLKNYAVVHQTDPVFMELMKNYATVIETLDRLQRFIDEHGISYQVYDVGGNPRDVTRAEAKEVEKLRRQVLDMARKMQIYTKVSGNEEDPDLTLLR